MTFLSQIGAAISTLFISFLGSIGLAAQTPPAPSVPVINPQSVAATTVSVPSPIATTPASVSVQAQAQTVNAPVARPTSNVSNTNSKPIPTPTPTPSMPVQVSSATNVTVASPAPSQTTSQATGAQNIIYLTATWDNPATAALTFTVTRPDGTTISQADFASNNIAIVPPLSTHYSETVAILNPVSNTGWSLNVVNPTGLGTVTSKITIPSPPTAPITGFSLQRVSGQTLIATLPSSVSSSDSVTFFADQDGKDFDGLPLTPSTISGSTATMNIEDLSNGRWYVYILVQSGDSPPMEKYSSNSIEVSGSSVTIDPS